MNDDNETRQRQDAVDDIERPVFGSSRMRWIPVAVLIAIVLVIICLFSIPGVTNELTRRLLSVLGLTSEVENKDPDGDSPPKATQPLTDEPTETVTEATGNSSVGDGACSDPCDPAASNCQAGLYCLPAQVGQYAYVCWADEICLASSQSAPTDVPTLTVTDESPTATGCGNGVCDPGESVYNCSPDCGQPPPPVVCGDGTCNGGESACNCTADCGGPTCTGRITGTPTAITCTNAQGNPDFRYSCRQFDTCGTVCATWTACGGC